MENGIEKKQRRILQVEKEILQIMKDEILVFLSKEKCQQFASDKLLAFGQYVVLSGDSLYQLLFLYFRLLMNGIFE